MNICSVGIVDDHVLFAQSLQRLINSFEGFEVAFIARNGSDLIEKMTKDDSEPEILLLDINMPVMNGFESMQWLNQNRPEIKTMALSMDDDEQTIIQMLKLGSVGYLLKDIHPDTLKSALEEVKTHGFYYSEQVNKAWEEGAKKVKSDTFVFSDRELEFLGLACSDKTYKEIADQMCLSPKTIDNYRDALFKKIGVKSRTGMVLYALKNKIISN